MAETADRRIDGRGGKLAVIEKHRKLRLKVEQAGFPKNSRWAVGKDGTKRIMDVSARRERLEDLKDPSRIQERKRLAMLRKRRDAMRER